MEKKMSHDSFLCSSSEISSPRSCYFSSPESKTCNTKLAEREFWENLYQTEIHNFEESEGKNKGEIWFSNETKKIFKWIEEKGFIQNEESTKIIDVGCGNGMFLVEIAKKYKCKHIVGLDYSKKSIEFANLIKNYFELPQINFVHYDFSLLSIKSFQNNSSANISDSSFSSSLCSTENEVPDLLANHTYDIVHDKGTLDIFILKGLEDVYVTSASKILHSNSLLIVTSCNATKEELINIFVSPKKGSDAEEPKHKNTNSKEAVDIADSEYYKNSLQKEESKNNYSLHEDFNKTNHEIENHKKNQKNVRHINNCSSSYVEQQCSRELAGFFVYQDELKHKTFVFSGKTGQTVTTLAFKFFLKN